MEVTSNQASLVPRWRFVNVFSHRFCVPVIFLLALLLSLPSLNIGLLSDDHYHRVILTDKLVVPEADDWSLLGLFSFEFGSAEHIYESVNIGALPWWSDPDMRMQFFRPLSEISHWIDYQLFPDQPALMHAHSILWYMVLLFASWLLLRRLFPVAWMAALALALHALDGSNGGAVGWIADRNALITTALGLLCVYFHLRGRWDRKPFLVVPAVLCFVVALLAGENGLSTTAFLFAFALWLDPAPTLWRRLWTLAPYTVVAVVWLAFYKWAQFGAHGSGMYIDPFSSPLQFAEAIMTRMPLMVESHFSALPVNLQETRMPGLMQLAFLLTAAMLIWPALRSCATSRFFVTGLLVSLLPVCAAKPEDRLLVFSSFAAMGLLASSVIYWLSRSDSSKTTVLAKVIAVIMLFVHLVISPATFIANYQLPAMALERLTTQPALTMPVTADDSDKDVVLVNPPVVAAAFFQAWVRIGNDLPVADNTWLLASGMRPLSFTRIDNHTLVLHPEDGFMDTANDWYIRSPENPLKVGEVIDQGRMQVRIKSLTADGRPEQVAFTFTADLDSDRIRFLRWQDEDNGRFVEGHWVDWTPPEVGESDTLSMDLSNKMLSASTKPLTLD